MEKIEAFNLKRMLIGNDANWLFLLEILVRTLIMYLFALLAIRIVNKRSMTKLSILEFLLVLVLGSATGDTMFYPQVPLLFGMTVVTGVITVNDIFNRLKDSVPFLNKLNVPNPALIVEEGKVLEKN